MGIINSQIAAIYNLTPLQEGMLFDTLMNQDSTSYHLQMVYIIRNNLNVELVEKAWQLITKKHEVLRTVFVNAAGIPRQVVLHERTPEFHYCDLRHIKNPKIQIHNYCEQDLKRGFDLIKDVLLRVELIQTDESVYQMVVSTHHILMDGWCLSLIINDFISFYQALDQGSSVLEVQHQIEAGHQKEESYGSYLNWLSGLNQDEAMEYWKEYLDSYDNVAQFIPDETAIVIPQQTAEYELTLSKEESAEITAFINKLGITYNVLTESAYGILLQKSTHTKDVVFAKTVAGRNVEKHNYQNTVGLFINSIPLRIRDEQETVQELLFKVFSDDLKSGQYDYCSLADIQNMVPCGKELIKTIYIFQNYAVAETESTYLDIEMENGREQINYDIGLMAFMDDSQLTLRIMFNPRKFTYDNIVRINHMLKNILMDMVHFPEKKISEISEVSKRDSIRLIHDFNQTTVLCAKYKSYAELFEEQVEKTPENMAVVYENESLTYAELNARANVIAHKLRSMGIKPEDFVVICAERSIEMLVGIYGIIKSGAAYVPIDPTYPVERMNFILEDCKPKAVLVYHSNIPGELPIIDLSSIAWDMYRENLSIINKPDNLIYCIYTSGTTGKPKGVLLEHHGVVNLGMYLKHELSVTSSDRVMLFANYVFDGSVWEILMAHMNGVCLYIPSDDTIRDTALMEQFLNFHRITISYFPPIYYEQINVKLPGFVITAGSQTSRTAVIKAVKNSDYINSYGPTEASVCTTCWKLPKGSEVPDILPIGKPISNMQVYILNDNQLCGIGIPGELCIAGEGLARGYLNQPELTSKKFVNNPFGKGKIYRSGDLARWLPDGNIEYMGRIDEQVKIRGFRIELGEIESRLRELEEIGDCAVIARADRSEGQELYAYYTSDVEVSASKVRYALSKVLPSYMVPSYIMQIKEIPVTRNGKLDKRALPDIVAGVAAYVAPKTETEYCICNIFSEILNVEKVGIMDNFFDLGGHSLKLSQLVNQIEKQLFIRIPLKTIFQINSPKALANLIDEEKQKAKEFSLQPAAEKEFYPASAVQNRLYVLQQIDEKGIAYNTPNNLEFDCLFDHKRFQIAFQQMINRHEIFRTAFITQEHQIMQKVFPELQVTAEFVSVKREDLTEYYRKFIRPFQLNSPPLIKIHVAETEDQHSVMMIDMHHIIADGVSLGIFIDEFSKLYNGEKLETPVLQYKDYSEWMLTRTAELEKQKKYWLEQYADEIPVLDLPLDYSRGALQTFEGRTLSITLNSEITQECRRLAKITQTTEFMIFLSALMVLLSKYSGQEDIVVGMPIANRISSETENMIGMFVNTLAIRGKPEKEKTFMQFLNEMKEHMLKAYDNQEFPFDELINSLPLERDVSRNPLFDVFITMTNMDIGDYHMNGMRMLNNELSVESQTAKFDLTINIQPLKDTYCISFEYATSLFSESSISVMMKHYVNLLQCIAKNSYQPLKTMEMFDITERNLILNYFVSTEVDETLEQSVTDLLYEQVMLHPEKDAVIFDTKSITYSELWNKVKNVAVWLMKQGVQPGDCVAVFCSRSIEMVVGIYGVMLAGAAYVPIDPTYPEERIQYILKDCVPKAVLLELNTIQVSVPKNLPVLTISELPNNYTDEHIVFPRVVSHDLAYIIYTSGTTGKPKGVMVEHQGVLNLKKHFISAYQISEDDVVMKFANAVFDASVWEINMALLSGATLFIITQQMIEQEVLLNQAIHDYNVTIGAFPPNYLAQLSEDTFASMRLVVTAGSVATNEIAEKVSRNCIYVNEYGPTEITVSATYWRLEKGESVPFRIPIGKPIINKQIYIIREGNLCGIGEPGEICIAGVGIARGYLNQPELTKNHFIDNPFGTGKLYRTGDLARWLPDGNLDFLGRIDEQVKIRGYRIELSEIETVLRNQEHITDVAVITKQSSQNNDIYLCAYFVAEIQLDTEALKNIMRKQLPEYMIPQVMIQLDEIPVTHNGKLDKRALLEIHQKNQDDYVAPLDEIEYIVAEILGEILAYKPFGRTWNFFRMGGNSITGIRVISMLKQQLNVKISMPELFENPTVAQLAELCKSSKQMVENQIQVAKKCDAYPVSSIQRRMYSLQQISDGIAYNSPSSIHITGCLNPERMEYAFQQLLKREEILHTSFHMKDDLVQVVEESYTVDFTVEELGQRDPAEIFEAFVRPFDLEKAPLIRMMVLKETNTQWYLFMDIHHIICDGASIDILWNELWNLYYGNEIPKRTLHYKDYSVWMEKRASEIQKQGEYWLSQFDDQIPVLELPLDKVRPPYQSFEGDFLTYKVESALRKQVLALAEKTNCTEYMILLSALAILLSKQSRQEDLVIGSVVGGRMHPGMEDMIGMFVNSLALRIKPVGTMRYIEYLDVVKNSCLKAFDNQEYPLENLIEALHISRDNSRNPLFDVMLVLQNNVVNKDQPGELIIEEGVNQKGRTSKFDLSFNISSDVDDTYIIILEYCTALYKKETIERLIEHYIEILKQVTENKDKKLKEIEMVTEKERHQILNNFNSTEAEYSRDKTVIELFEEQAARVPDKIAVNYKERSLTFRELNEKANAVAEQLINSGADRNQFVAVIADRGLEMMIALLGVMKSGAAYVPIDPELPQERIEYMLKDCGAKQVVIYGSKIGLELKTVVLTAAEKIENVAKNPTVDRSPDDLIYLIYTSGTTGRPKAVMLQHSNVVADIAQFCKKICVTEETVSLQQALYAFDMFVEEVYPTLCSGGEISILPREYAADGMKMSEYINEHKVSLIHCSPLQMNELNQLNILKTVETYIVGSDRLKIEYISNILKKREVRVLQGYGPTETTVVATLHTIKAKGEEWDPESVGVTVPIGKPKDNCKIYILNENTLCGIGVPGELCITGDGLARGYLNQPELTAEKFVDNPFGEGKMYRSGDLARWLSDGNIEFLGRIDEQVKIRGFRIELGEIESRIKEIEGVKDCVVIVRTDKNGDKAIYAYYIGEKEISISEIRDKLSESLPDYMIPSYMMQIESIPVTRNGKLDKRVLPEIKVKVTREYIAPRNEVEKAICDVFEKILHVEKVGIKNNFFELGGDSIKAIRIISELRNIGYTITVKDIMNGKTAEKVALNVKVQLAKRKYEQGEVVGKVEKTPTMCEFERLNLAKPEHFNQATILFVSEFSNEIIHRAVNELVIHHDILRAVYRNNILEILSVSESKLCDFYEFDYSEESDKQRAIEKQCTKIQESIDLENGPLVKIAVFDLGAEKIMMFCIHHLVVDGVSWRILLEDFEIVAEQLKVGKEVKLPEKTASFIEWSNMLNEYVSNSNQDFAYWKNTIEQIAEINFIRTNLNYRADSVDIVIDSKTTKDILYNVNEKYHTKIDDILICALEMAVARWKHKDKIAIAIESHGREEINNEFVIDRTVGWFTSMYPVILQYYDDLEKNIISTKETLRSIPNNGLTYGLFDNQKDVVPDICFNYLGQIDINKQNENSVYYSAGKPIADENRLLGKINFNGSIIDNELHFEISFNQYEIEHNSAILLGEMYENALYDIVKHCVECKETVMTMSDLDTNDLNNDDMNSINDFFDSLFC